MGARWVTRQRITTRTNSAAMAPMARTMEGTRGRRLESSGSVSCSAKRSGSTRLRLLGKAGVEVRDRGAAAEVPELPLPFVRGLIGADAAAGAMGVGLGLRAGAAVGVET